jgi:D-alanine-D-alanine ligase
MRKKVLVIGGGFSVEREISLKTSKNFFRLAKESGYQAEFLDFSSLSQLIKAINKIKPSVVLNGLHGIWGEDGKIQSVLEFLQIPYTGSGVVASAICISKYHTKLVARQLKIKTPEAEIVQSPEGLQNLPKINPPYILKPNAQGSSVGVLKLQSVAELKRKLPQLFKLDKLLLIEQYIEGTEITVGVFNGKALEPIQINPLGGFYDYKHKYTKGLTQFYLPARLSPKIIAKAKAQSEYLFKVLNLHQYCRVDFIVAGSSIYLLEINTLPGFTETSLMPKALSFEGISPQDFVKDIIETSCCNKF